MLLYTWQEAGKEGRLILSSGAKYNQINFSKNHVSGNARKIGVTFIWWFTDANERLQEMMAQLSNSEGVKNR
jgi:hypothetical protein